MSRNLVLSKEQTEVIKAAAASVQPCWRERFLFAIQDRLLSYDPITDENVIAALDAVCSDYGGC